MKSWKSAVLLINFTVTFTVVDEVQIDFLLHEN
jgi:hypothetical protein